MTDATPARPIVGSLPDLLAAVPYLLGFHPADSLVVIGAKDRALAFAARADLPDGSPAEAAAYVAEVCARQPIQVALIIGYGPAGRVEPALFALRDMLDEHGVPVSDVLRVTDRHYWSYTCADPTCCDPSGTRFDPSASAVAAAATFAGAVALPDRAALVATVAPVDGSVREAVSHATERAGRRLAALLGSPAARRVRGRAVLGAGVAAVRQALRRHRSGGVLTDDELAWLSVLLCQPSVRDAAWRLMRPDPRPYLGLWTDVVRRASPDLVPPPACLLGLGAWRTGDGALAAVAVERALAANSAYPLALLLDEALRSGLPPSAVDSVDAVRR